MSAMCVLTNPPGDSKPHTSLRKTGLDNSKLRGRTSLKKLKILFNSSRFYRHDKENNLHYYGSDFRGQKEHSSFWLLVQLALSHRRYLKPWKKSYNGPNHWDLIWFRASELSWGRGEVIYVLVTVHIYMCNIYTCFKNHCTRKILTIKTAGLMKLVCQWYINKKER